MPRKSNIPIRICGTKTRTGCKTCKQRHVKCDEGRPVCLNCEKKNRPCIYDAPSPDKHDRVSGSEPETGASDPYFNSLKSTNKTPLNAQPKESTELQHRPVLRSPNPHKTLSPFSAHELSELGAVNSFATHLGKELAGAFSDEIWCQILPRMAQYEPSVWHGMVAITMLDESIRLGHEGASNVRKAIAQYGKAMLELNARLQPGPNDCCKDVVLVSCILFTLFECVQNHLYSALRHIRGGMNLLLEWSDEKDSTGGYLNYTMLQPIFLSLDSQAIQLGAVAFRDYTSLPAINGQPNAPASFATTDDAHLSLNQIFNRISHWAQWCEPSTAIGTKPDNDWMVEERRRIQTQLAGWDSAFSSLAPLCDFEPSTLLLLVQRKVLQVFFDRHADGPSELEWDKYLNVFQEALGLAERYMELTKVKTQEPSARPILVVAMDLVLPLFLIGAKCRHGATRRRALTMLKTYGHKEGIWDSDMCSRLAERMMELEETGADEDGFIPENARICELDVRLAENEDEASEVRQKRLIPDENGSRRVETVEEAMAW